MISWPSFLLGIAAIVLLSIAAIGVLAGLALRARPAPRAQPRPATVVPFERQRRAAHLRLC